MSMFLNRLIDYRDIPNSKTFKENLYQYYKIHNYDDASLFELSKRITIPFAKLEEYLYDYIQRNMLMSKDEFKKYIIEEMKDKNKEAGGLSNPHTHKRDSDTKIKQCFDNIIKCDDISKIDEIIAKSGYILSNLEYNFTLYRDYYTTEEKQIYYQKMKDYLEYHQKRVKEETEAKKQLNLKNKLDEMCAVVNEYMLQGDDISLKMFLKEKEIHPAHFQKYIDTIKKYKPSKYDEYKNYELNKEKRKSRNLANAAKEIGKYLREGYNEDGIHRDFDLIDYFLITKYKLNEVYEAAKRVLPSLQLSLIRRFVMNNLNADENQRNEIKAIYAEKRTVGVKYDENNNVIPNTGRIINDEEKKLLIDFLTNNRIPINRFTYRAALKRYLNGYILNDDTMLLTKKNK